ncbi:FUSC family protein [Cellvibrio mixtus]|uniref:FUSC family protein n=1 Tax=Cellvibrio mixtus TaxID=39650 RepID=UPI000A941A71|nr:FUSC family protein [Cellvibrio mixtus]
MHKLLAHIRQLLVLKKATRPWHIPFMASLAIGVPALLGAYFSRFDMGILGCMGAMVFLYIQPIPMSQRMLRLIVSSFGFSVCFALGLITGFNHYLAAATLFCVAFFATIITRLYAIPPPGSFFFILVAVMGMNIKFDLALIPVRVGLITLGAILSCVLAFFYSLWAIRRQPVIIPESVEAPRVYALVLEAGVIAFFVGGSYGIALSIGLGNPYWVPISCAAIMQGATFRMVWQRKVHRIVGTAIGLSLATVIFKLPLNPYEVALLIMLLNFIVEFLVVRNYGLAVVFITPLTVLFAEVSSATLLPDVLLTNRLLDIVLGSVIGFVGGWLMYQPGIFIWAEGKLKTVFGKSQH